MFGTPSVNNNLFNTEDKKSNFKNLNYQDNLKGSYKTVNTLQQEKNKCKPSVISKKDTILLENLVGMAGGQYTETLYFDEY